jgi:hypothetical protein
VCTLRTLVSFLCLSCLTSDTSSLWRCLSLPLPLFFELLCRCLSGRRCPRCASAGSCTRLSHPSSSGGACPQADSCCRACWRQTSWDFTPGAIHRIGLRCYVLFNGVASDHTASISPLRARSSWGSVRPPAAGSWSSTATPSALTAPRWPASPSASTRTASRPPRAMRCGALSR